MSIINGVTCPRCECRWYPAVERHCPICDYYPPPPPPAGIKPFGWEVTFEHLDGNGQLATKTIHRVGPVSKARRAARLTSNFRRITEERHILTEGNYRKAFGNYDQRM